MNKTVNKLRILEWITLIILTNLLSVYLLISGTIRLPNTLLLYNENNEFLSELDKINTLSEIVNRNYVGEVDNKAIGEKLADTLFTSLNDPYSEYYTKEEYDSLSQSYLGTFGGVGIKIDGSDPNNLVIVDTVKDSPAQEAGIQKNDILTKVNGEDIRGQSLELVVSKTRGEIGTPVTITVERDGQEQEFTLSRQEINENTVYSENMDGIGYIFIESFGNGTADQFKEELDKLLNENITGLVIDLRYNPGGIVDSAVEVADTLLGKDVLAYTLDKQENRKDIKTAVGAIDIPYVILVNNVTASASEILAGGAQKAGATIIGEKTFGKGVIQAMSELQDGSGYKLTFQEYYLKDGTKVNGIGITPDIVVEEPGEEAIFGDINTDTQLQKAIETLQNK